MRGGVGVLLSAGRQAQKACTTFGNSELRTQNFQNPFMKFDSDAFISYAHLDNQELSRVAKAGSRTSIARSKSASASCSASSRDIWRDPKLQGNDFFADTLDRAAAARGGARGRRVAALRQVRVDPPGARPSSGRRAQEQGGVRVGDKARVFKVLKTPVPLEQQPAELQRLLGYEFFRIDPETGKVRELDEVFGPEAQRDFWMKLDDLAHDLSRELLESSIERMAPTPAPRRATREGRSWPTRPATCGSARDAIRRDLQQQGYTCCPSRPLPMARRRSRGVRPGEDLSRCKLSIHLVGQDLQPRARRGVSDRWSEIQNELAIERGDRRLSAPAVDPAGLRVDDERQQKFIESHAHRLAHTRGRRPARDLARRVAHQCSRARSTAMKQPAGPRGRGRGRRPTMALVRASISSTISATATRCRRGPTSCSTQASR